MAKKIKIDKSKIVKRAPTVSTVQAVVFAKGWKQADAKEWLAKNNFKPIGKVQETKKRVHSNI